MGMKTENPSGSQAVSAFLDLPVDKFLKAIGCRERVDRTLAATHGLAGWIVEIDDVDLFHGIQIGSGCVNRKL